MKFTLDLACDNAAFTDDGEESRNDETARILREIAKQLDAGYVKGFAYDGNGNRVGTFKFYEEA